MHRIFRCISVICLLLLGLQMAIHAQSTASINGTVVDPNGAVVPGANIKIKGEGGQEFTAVTNDSGVYRVPAVANGLYTVTITAQGFKTATVSKVKVDTGIPATVDAKLEIGNVGEVVEISSGGEVLQTQTATVGNTVTGRQIKETPIASRDALDLVQIMPGTATIGRPRSSTINGLPRGSLTITLDGVDVQANDSRSSDGFFTYVRPRVDAIEEVTVSTAAPGSESSGDGAVQIKFVTKRGNNDYHGGTFIQHRNEALNANYWYLNRTPTALDADGRSKRQKIRLFQYGANVSGPIPLPGFGEGVDKFSSGRDKRFFFVNYEEFRLPQSLTRSPRKVATPDLQNGIYKYRASSAGFTTLPSTPTTTCVPFAGTTPNQMECSVNILAIAQANNQLATIDPTVAGIFSRIRSSLNGITLAPIASNPNLLDYNLTASSNDIRKFLATRFDINVTKKHSVEFVMNRQEFGGTYDLLNSREPTFPGFPGYSQTSQRNSYTVAVRSTLSKNIVNEGRYAISGGGPSLFAAESSAAGFDFMGGRSISIGATVGGTAITNPAISNSNTIEKNPVYDFTDSVTWIKGNHSINFGGQYKKVETTANSTSRFVPSVTFGLASTETALMNMFTTCSSTNFTQSCRLPAGGSTQQSETRGLYAVLIGHITGYTDTAYLDTRTNKYAQFIPRYRLAHQNSYGLFVQDNWKIRSNFSINYGVRWQPQTGFVADTFGNYTQLENPDQVYGTSGVGNLFKPGATGGTAPRVVAVPVGESVYPTDWNNFAPSVGVVWSPSFGESGFARRLFGKSGQSVFRAGYSVSFVREGTDLLGLIAGANPGGTRVLSRSTSIAGSLTVGTNLRDPNNPNLKAFDPTNILGSSPVFPIELTTSDSTNGFNPKLKTGQVASYSFGYQRELDRNTVIEARFVGTKGTGLQRQININEFNAVENGFANEFRLAQQNLYANIAANRCQTGVTSANCQFNFAYFGPGTGTSPLPLMLSYITSFGSASALQAASQLATNYGSSTFLNTTLVAGLNRNNPNVAAFSGTSFESDATRRANALANGLPANFFYVNPSTPSGSWTVENNNETWYNSGVLELRRRLSAGLRVNASYVFAKAMANAFTSDAAGGNSLPPTVRDIGYQLARNLQISDIRHVFKFDGTYDLPFGKGRKFLSSANGFVNAFLGGWTLAPVVRWQSGSPISIGRVQLVGMDRKELQKAVKIRKEANLVYWLPEDIIVNSQKAFDLNINNTSATGTGYGTTFGTGGPTGRFIAPAGYGNCISDYIGKCGFANLTLHGPSFFKVDATLSKAFSWGENRSIELRVTSLDVLNHPNFRIGGWTTDTGGAGCCTSTFGQLATGSAYQDTSTTNDPGGRLVDVMLRINW